MSAKTIVTVDYVPVGGGPRSVSPPLEFDTYDAFLAKCLVALATCLGGRGRKARDWQMVAVTAQDSLSVSSAVRRRKGYSLLYLDDEIRNTQGLHLKDGSHSPKEGREVLYAVSSGSGEARMTILRLGMCSESSFVACSADPALNDSLNGAIQAGMVVTENATDRISWNHTALFNAIPRGLCVLGLIGLPLGPLRVQVSAREDVGYRLQTAICRDRG